ncbi:MULTISPECIES: BT_3928 family protein [Myroides]|uniref:DoxX family membrane protein n=1 Tax=Myroides albus TaxID=2562892 RepID=A0A6I3LMN4_9FLAO|nr:MULTISPECIES: BT_3928 family protein [Myroides]MTG97851.1 DoxX family membrane protein [Myroides albus]MVX35973.1 DoxX family membrane protein [Myroides sp. LoEW2-1]UVD79808.1 DoxX family protein [Myroides albus]
MKVLTQLSRLFVGVLFILSGLVKLNDPSGFSFKLEEYFSTEVLDLPFLIPYALALAVIIVIAEVLLGAALLIGYKRKLTLWSLFLMILFFTFLTFYSAFFNKVTDCGCFGDAVPLTPWGSFTKDIILLIFILILLKGGEYITPLFKRSTNNIIMLVVLLLCSFMGYWVLNHLPLKDFRAYKVGTDIMKGMEIPEDAPRAKYEMNFYYEVDGEEKKFTDKELGNIPEGSKFIRREDFQISAGYIPPIHDFSMDKDGEDHTAELMAEPKLVLIISYDLDKADTEGLKHMKDFANKAIVNNYKVIGMTASSQEKIDKTIKDFQLPFEYYTCDGTTLKTIERANPSIVVLNKGVIVEKKHWNDRKNVNL